MTAISEPAKTGNPAPSDGEAILESAFRGGAPIVAFLGQTAGWSSAQNDPILTAAFKKAGKVGSDWRSLLSREMLPAGFFEWLSERFVNRAPSREVLTIAD